MQTYMYSFGPKLTPRQLKATGFMKGFERSTIQEKSIDFKKFINNIAILQYCNIAMLYYCNIARLQYCNIAIKQYCNTAIGKRSQPFRWNIMRCPGWGALSQLKPPCHALATKSDDAMGQRGIANAQWLTTVSGPISCAPALSLWTLSAGRSKPRKHL